MKLRALGVALVLVLLPAGLRAQIVRRGPTGEIRAAETVHIYRTLIDKMIPLLQAEAKSSKDLDARLAAVGMSKQEYVANKNALMIARQDDLNPGRLVAIKNDLGAHQVRQANAQLYHANAARLSAALARLEPEPGCALCGPTAPVKSAPAPSH